jgi:hypothetical protein
MIKINYSVLFLGGILASGASHSILGTALRWRSGSWDISRNLMIPVTSLHSDATRSNSRFLFCLRVTCCRDISVQERVPQLYVHSPYCRVSSVTRSRGASRRQLLRLQHPLTDPA